MIRRKVPKGADFAGITEDDTLRVQRWVNEYPRGILTREAGIKGLELLLLILHKKEFRFFCI